MSAGAEGKLPFIYVPPFALRNGITVIGTYAKNMQVDPTPTALWSIRIGLKAQLKEGSR